MAIPVSSCPKIANGAGIALSIEYSRGPNYSTMFQLHEFACSYRRADRVPLVVRFQPMGISRSVLTDRYGYGPIQQLPAHTTFITVREGADGPTILVPSPAYAAPGISPFAAGALTGVAIPIVVGLTIAWFRWRRKYWRELGAPLSAIRFALASSDDMLLKRATQDLERVAGLTRWARRLSKSCFEYLDAPTAERLPIRRRVDAILHRYGWLTR